MASQLLPELGVRDRRPVRPAGPGLDLCPGPHHGRGPQAIVIPLERILLLLLQVSNILTSPADINGPAQPLQLAARSTASARVSTGEA